MFAYKMSKLNKNDWCVKVSSNQKNTPFSSILKPAVRRVTFQSSKPVNGSKESSEELYRNLLKWLNDSRKEIQMEGRDMLESLEKWRQTTIARFDSLQQYLDRMHDLQTTSVNNPTPSDGQQKTNFSSLPVLDDESENEDDLDDFLATPLLPLTPTTPTAPKTPSPSPPSSAETNKPNGRTAMFKTRAQKKGLLNGNSTF